MVHFGTPRVDPIHTPNIGPIDEGLISISAMESQSYCPDKRINAPDVSYDGTTTKKLRPNGGWSISWHQGSVLSTPLILDPSMKDWYQYLPWNTTHRAQLRESMHMTYHTTALLANSCGPMADGPFRDTKVWSYPHPKYWTHRWRIHINIDHGISPIEHRAQLRESSNVTYQTTALLSNSCGPMADGPFRDPMGRSNPHPKYWTNRWRIDITIVHGISRISHS